MKKIRVAVVDDQTLIREGLAALLAMQTDIQVIGQASDGRAALELVAARAPEVVLMDVRMPGMNGVAATREIRARFPETRVLVLTTYPDDDYIFEALRVGASGYLLKNTGPDELTAAIRAVHAGEMVLDPAVTQKVIQRATYADQEEPVITERLTKRESEVLGLLAEGASNAEIAERLSLARGTVKNHISHILGKLGARDRTHAVRLAVEWGLLDTE